MAKKTNRRSQKKELLKRFEANFDLAYLNLDIQVKRIKPKAMLVGLISAMVLYSVGFALAYVAMSANTIPLELFAKLVWMLMIPTTIIGFFMWQLSRSRMEYPIRMEIREYMEEKEAQGGLLWRFLPILEDEVIESPDLKKAFSWSSEGKIDKLDIEDYIAAVYAIDDTLRGASSASQITQNMVEQVENNFSHSKDVAA